MAGIPVLALFFGTGIVVLAARAPRTWSQHWTAPTLVSNGSGQNEYGAVPLSGHRWDLLWVNTAASSIVFTHQTSNRSSDNRSYTIDVGDVAQPDIHRYGSAEFGVWVRNFNGSTSLEGASFSGGHPLRTFTLLHTVNTIEHPHPFVGPHNSLDVVFAWQHPNYDLFLARVDMSSGRFLSLAKLTNAQYYSFYPKVAVDGRGHIVTLHLESCCQQQKWNFLLTRFTASGKRLGQPLSLAKVQDSGDVPQWAEDLETDPAGNVWGAITGDSGVRLVEISPSGQEIIRPRYVTTLGSNPDTLALALGKSSRFLFWQQPSLFGGWLAAGTLDRHGRLLHPERAVYESGTQANPHATIQNGTPEVMWEDVTRYGAATFQMSQRQANGHPSLAQRLGLGVGNTWEDIALLAGGTLAVAALGLAANVIDVLVIIALGLVFMRVTRRLKVRWFLYALFVSGLLFVLFVNPGAPLLFLTTLSGASLPVQPYGVLATLAVFALLLWLSSTLMKHIDDVYRAGALVCAGVFFFAYVEAITLIQGQLSYLG